VECDPSRCAIPKHNNGLWPGCLSTSQNPSDVREDGDKGLRTGGFEASDCFPLKKPDKEDEGKRGECSCPCPCPYCGVDNFVSEVITLIRRDLFLTRTQALPSSQSCRIFCEFVSLLSCPPSHHHIAPSVLDSSAIGIAGNRAKTSGVSRSGVGQRLPYRHCGDGCR
jgi:hypothetical protein